MRPAPMLVILAALALVGCGESRPRGEPGGVPVAFSVDLDWAYIDQIARSASPPPPVFVPAPYYYGRYHYYRRGPGPYLWEPDPWYDQPRSTDVWLLGGDGPAEAGVFRVPIATGHTDFEVPIRAGHVVTISVQARGDREGWEAVGHFTAADRPGQRVHLSLTADGSKMDVAPPPDAAPAPAVDAAPPAAPAP